MAQAAKATMKIELRIFEFHGSRRRAAGSLQPDGCGNGNDDDAHSNCPAGDRCATHTWRSTLDDLDQPVRIVVKARIAELDRISFGQGRDALGQLVTGRHLGLAGEHRDDQHASLQRNFDFAHHEIVRVVQPARAVALR